MKTVPGLDHNPAACEPGIQDELLDRLERFDLAWRNGTPPRIDAFLEAVEAHGCAAGMAPPRSRLLAELVKIDMEYRWRVDEFAAQIERPGPLLEHYLERFPELGPVERIPADLIGEEYRLRRRVGEPLAHPDSWPGFPAATPELCGLLSSIDTELAVERSAAAVWLAAARASGAGGAGLSVSGRPPPSPRRPRPDLHRAGISSSIARSPSRRFTTSTPIGLTAAHRFIREAEITGRLEHPGIVPVYGMGRNSDGTPSTRCA